MRKMYKIVSVFIMMGMLTLLACQDDDRELGEIVTPENLTVETTIVGQDDDNPFGDGSGEVLFTLNADNALSYDVVFNNSSNVSTSGDIQVNFTENGVVVYNLVAVANGAGGTRTSIPLTVEVFTSFLLPPSLLDKLTGTDDRSVASSKTWRIKSDATAHFGLGPVGDSVIAAFFGTAPFEKDGVGMYDDEYIFSSDGTFTHLTNGTVFGRVNLIDELGSSPDENTTIESDGNDIVNLPYDDFNGSWTASGSEELVNINLSGLGFIGYYVGGNHSYELFQFQDQADNDFVLRTTDGNNGFDWWFIITSEDEGEGNAEGEETGGLSLDVVYREDGEDPFWAEEFNIDGAPDANSWGYDIGTGNNGWGNGEEQYYTDRSDNVIVSDGTLKITAKRESFSGSEFTSTRMLTQDKFEFTHGRVDVRARLPFGVGTWPAIWMLGANFPEVGWPATGEIDIMEHVGRNQDIISHALHNPAGFGGNPSSSESEIVGVSDDFHVYSVNWSPDQIIFLVDDEITFSYNPSPKNLDNYPYIADQFIILNVAMGGSFGGDIDPDFVESTMEVDYIRVYQ